MSSRKEGINTKRRKIGMNNLKEVLMLIISMGIIAILILSETTLGEVTRTGLITELHFDGDSKDSSGNGYDGIVYGTTFVDGRLGKAMVFNGVDNYIQLPPFNSIWQEGFTACAWTKFERNNDGNYERIIDLGNGDGDTYGDNIAIARAHTNNDIEISVWSGTNGSISRSEQIGGGTLVAQNGILVGEWAFYCGTDDTFGNMNLYRNGALLTNRQGLPVSNVARTKNYIGHSNWPWNDPNFKGLIEDVRIYNRALSAEEVKNNYDTGRIIITSSPPGSQVLINDISKGIASPTLSLYGVSPGSYNVRCELAGYSDYNTNVVLTTTGFATVTCLLPQIISPAPTPVVSTPVASNTPVQPPNEGILSYLTDHAVIIAIIGAIATIIAALLHSRK